jgi:hypothetical protein
MTNVTRAKLTNMAAVAAILAGLMFMAIQPLHPADTLASVTTAAWAIIHFATMAMLVLFVIGITGIYLAQVEKLGWLGLVGFVVLAFGLTLTAFGTAIEALVQPVIASSSPAFVQGMMDMVDGRPTAADLGAVPTLWNLASALFLAGTVLFGLANFRANILSRPASAIFAAGLVVSLPLATLVLGMPRLAALPIGFGLAWLGYSLLTRQRALAAEPVPIVAVPQSGAA